MKPLAIRSSEKNGANEDSASLVIATIPVVMRAFKGKMRASRPEGLSVPQFRALIFIDKRTSTSISDIAKFLGLALSTTSKLVDCLVKRHYVERTTAENDRRRAMVTLTDLGKFEYKTTRAQAHAYMRESLKELSEDEKEAVATAMRALYRIFLPAFACASKE